MGEEGKEMVAFCKASGKMIDQHLNSTIGII